MTVRCLCKVAFELVDREMTIRFSADRLSAIALMMQLWLNSPEMTAVRLVISGGKIPMSVA
jgi:hypothetical protein